MQEFSLVQILYACGLAIVSVGVYYWHKIHSIDKENAKLKTSLQLLLKN